MSETATTETATTSATPTPLAKLLQALEMTPEETPSFAARPSGTEAASERSTWRGESLDFPTGNIYGGQIVAQVLCAAARTVPEGRLPHSVHAYFTTPGDLHHGVCYDVDTLRDGRSFSARNVTARQGERGVLTAIASFQVAGQDGMSFADPMPSVPSADTLQSSFDLMRPWASTNPLADYFVNRSPWDMRHVQEPVLLKPDPRPEDSRRVQTVWMRADSTGLPEADLQRLRTDQTLQRAVLAAGCDQLMMEPALRRARLSFLTPGIRFATIDHSMWWYGAFDATRWHLYVQNAPIAGHGRALCHARVYQDGDLVAEIMQEAMIRVPGKTLSAAAASNR